MRVFLARHGETEWNVQHRLQGRADTSLTERGRAQARALAEFLSGVPLAAVYTSTLGRSIDTARPLAEARGMQVQPRAELVEISYGVLEGHTSDDPDAAIRRLWQARKRDPLGFRAPGAETYAELRDRLLPFAAELRARHVAENALVVGHRGTNRVLLGLLLGRSLEESMGFRHRHDCVLEIRPGGDPECRSHRTSPVAESGSEP